MSKTKATISFITQKLIYFTKKNLFGMIATLEAKQVKEIQIMKFILYFHQNKDFLPMQ